MVPTFFLVFPIQIVILGILDHYEIMIINLPIYLPIGIFRFVNLIHRRITKTTDINNNHH